MEMDAIERKMREQEAKARERLDVAERRALELQDDVIHRAREELNGVEWGVHEKWNAIDQMVNSAWREAEQAKGDMSIASEANYAWREAEQAKGDVLKAMRTKQPTTDLVAIVQEKLDIVLKIVRVTDTLSTMIDIVINAFEILIALAA